MSALTQPILFTSLVPPTDRENSAAAITNAIYRQILKRSADASGLAAYVPRIESGETTVKEVVRDLVQSDEWARRFIHDRGVDETVLALYECLLSRAPDLQAWDQLTAWVPKDGWADVINGILDGPEYNERFGERLVPGTPA